MGVQMVPQEPAGGEDNANVVVVEKVDAEENKKEQPKEDKKVAEVKEGAEDSN